MPTGARAGKYSKHISKLCCRCGLEEDDIHLFFTCCFSKAAWFSDPWYIRTEVLISNAKTLTQILQSILNLNHPHVNLKNVLNFMWCIWKARNDLLFNKKDCHPTHIKHRAYAINQNFEKMETVQVPANRSEEIKKTTRIHDAGKEIPEIKQGDTIKTDMAIKGNKIYTDAAWKTKKSPGFNGRTATGLGIFCQLQHSSGQYMVMIQAAMTTTPSPLHAEAAALVFAVQLAEQMNISPVTFLTDNLNLAKAASA
jgi:hypothetical protein